MAEQTKEQVTTEVLSKSDVNNNQIVPVKREDILPLNYQKALASYSEEEQKEIMALSDSIDVTQLDNVMNYGASVMKMTFDQCGEFLKSERGSHADQEVIKQVIELSKKAKDEYEDFELVLKEPGLLQKLLLKISTGAKKSDKIQHSAVTNYKLLLELQDSCESWIDMLKEGMGEISESAINDMEAVRLLEKYIIAGKLAQSRIETQVKDTQIQYQETGLQKYSDDYEMLKEGFEDFTIRMSKLEESRIAYYLSIAQLRLIKRGNKNVQISVHTQAENSITLMSQQIRNAVLNAKTREVLEGQKAITKLNNELIKEISKTVGLTTSETEKLMYAGLFDVEAAKEAVQYVISSCTEIENTRNEMLPKLETSIAELNSLLEDLQPYVDSVQTLEDKMAPTTVAVSKDLKF